MPSIKSNKNKWGLPANTAPEGVRCISVPVPDDEQWIAKFYGAIYSLAQQINWDRDEEHTAEVVAARWWQVYYATLQGDCMADDCETCLERMRVDPATGRLQYQLEDLSWFTVPDGPWSEGVQEPTAPPPPPRDGTVLDNRCLAAANAALVLQLMYQQTWDWFTNGITSNILGFISNTFKNLQSIIPINLPFDELVDLGIAGWENSEQFTDGGFPDEDLPIIQCILYCRATDTDGVVTFDYDGVYADLAATDQSALRFILPFLGGQGLNAAGGVKAITEADCSCLDCCDNPGSNWMVYPTWDDLDSFVTGHFFSDVLEDDPQGFDPTIGWNWRWKVRIDLGQVRRVKQVQVDNNSNGVARAIQITSEDAPSLFASVNPATGRVVSTLNFTPTDMRYLWVSAVATNSVNSRRFAHGYRISVHWDC